MAWAAVRCTECGQVLAAGPAGSVPEGAAARHGDHTKSERLEIAEDYPGDPNDAQGQLDWAAEQLA